MLKIQKYVRAESLEEAYQELIKNRNNQIIGGMLWLKMEDRVIPSAIDLSKCQLDSIEENENEFKIGAMCTFHQLETHEALNQMCQGMIAKSVRDIVGVQFKNMATIGGSIYSRFGFSDILTALLCLDCDVVCYKKGQIALKEYIHEPYEKDILTHVIIHKRKMKAAFECVRRSSTDFSVLNAAGALIDHQLRICVGARPHKAEMIEIEEQCDLQDILKQVHEAMPCESNMRASKEYREHLRDVLVEKIVNELKGEKA